MGVKRIRDNYIPFYEERSVNIMMREYEYYFAMTLHTRLKPRIKGKIYVKVDWDILYVEITTLDDLVYEWTKDNFSDAFLNGYTTEYAAYEIEKDFKRFIADEVFNKYFWND